MHNLLRSKPVIRKGFKKIDTPSGSSPTFQRHSYSLLQQNGYVIVHYLGDECAAIDFPHKNQKDILTTRNYTQTCPSVMRSPMLITISTCCLQNCFNISCIFLIPVLHPRNSNQVEIYGIKFYSQSAYLRCTTCITLRTLPSFIHRIETFPDLICSCGNNKTLIAYFLLTVLHHSFCHMTQHFN